MNFTIGIHSWRNSLYSLLWVTNFEWLRRYLLSIAPINFLYCGLDRHVGGDALAVPIRSKQFRSSSRLIRKWCKRVPLLLHSSPQALPVRNTDRFTSGFLRNTSPFEVSPSVLTVPVVKAIEDRATNSSITQSSGAVMVVFGTRGVKSCTNLLIGTHLRNYPRYAQ